MSDDWRPIETAPKDVERCLLWCSDLITEWRKDKAAKGAVFGRVCDGYVYADGMNGDWSFSHWMPLPEPPHA